MNTTNITKPIGRLSFATYTTTKRGRWLGRNHFDVAPEPYMQGMVTGQRLALELMRDIKANPDSYKNSGELQLILADAAKAKKEARSIKHRVFDTPTREGAAHAFLAEVIRYFAFGVTQANFEKHTAGVIQEQIQLNEQMEAYDKKRKAVSTAAGIATRRANRALKAAGGADHE